MDKEKSMILGYIVGGLLVVILVPSIIFVISALFDNIIKLEIIKNQIIRMITIPILVIFGFIYGIWSIIIQNTIGKGGPVEIGNIEISPKTKNLVISGPYKNTRNPMLFGTFLIYIAYAIFLNTITAIVVVILIFILMLTIVVKMEEKRLLKDFGKQYKDYKGRVPIFFPWFQKNRQ
jgi:protein-S-isoprenylcysteine O-methyltransferase Ste14